MIYRLHYAPDNASMIVRFALEHGNIPYQTCLVDRRVRQQRSDAYRALNPHGTIPVLEGPDGPIFETAAILIWLVDRHKGLGPQSGDPHRADFLKWLLSFSNTLHPALRAMFYPEMFIDGNAEQNALRAGTRRNINTYLDNLEPLLASGPEWLGAETPTAADFYLAAMVRWLALYPSGGPRWYTLSRWPALYAFAERRDRDTATRRVAEAEGLGLTPISAPHYPNPPEGSAL